MADALYERKSVEVGVFKLVGRLEGSGHPHCYYEKVTIWALQLHLPIEIPHDGRR